MMKNKQMIASESGMITPLEKLSKKQLLDHIEMLNDRISKLRGDNYSKNELLTMTNDFRVIAKDLARTMKNDSDAEYQA